MSIGKFVTAGSVPGMYDMGEHGEVPLLVIVTGVWGEAKGVIEKFDFAPHQPAPGITVYGNADVIVGICGKGPKHAHRYCTELARWLDQTGSANGAVWLNYGSAGSADHALGTMVQGVGSCVCEGSVTGNISAGNLPGVPGVIVRTHNRPDSGYVGGMVHDMEAAGFLKGIGAVVAHPDLYVLKLICDGPQSPWHETDKHSYQALLDAGNEKLLRLVDIIRGGKN